jgi:hypothetical protein
MPSPLESQTTPSHPETAHLRSGDGEKANSQWRIDSSNEAKTERKVTGVKWAIVMVSLLSSTFLYALDNTVMANVRPSIVETFNRIDFLPWLSVSYPLGEVGANPIWYAL